MEENSQAGIFENIFIDIGDEQSIENDLSTYSSHLLNMKYFIKNANEETLVLIDEFGSGTEPMLGGAIAESILNKLNNNYKKAEAILKESGSGSLKAIAVTSSRESQSTICTGLAKTLQSLKPLFRSSGTL